jgi:lipid-A-disaccharide synthase
MAEKKILIVAGEASGDLHASNLIRAIKQLNPQIKFFGLGGKQMEKEGTDLYRNIVELAVVGLFEVIKNLRKFKNIFDGILKEVDLLHPDLAILVDYPGFNLRLAAELKKRNVPVIYYISPQVWAWGAKRIKTIKKLIARMIVVFKFEEGLYKEYGIPVSFAGHPLLDIVKPKISKEELFRKFGLDLSNTTFALLPGSREKEVKTLLPIMLQTAKLIHEKLPHSQFLILRSTTVKENIFNNIFLYYNRLPIQILSDITYDGVSASDFAIVASGTATLETAILGTPMVILYKVSFLTWAYLKMAIRIPYIGLVNVVKQEKFIQEFIQYAAKPKRIADYIIDTFMDKKKLEHIRDGLSSVTAMLGEKGANQKAAQLVVDFLNQPTATPA